MTVDGVCPSCLKSPQKAIVTAQQRIAKIERKSRHLNEVNLLIFTAIYLERF